MAGVSVSSVTAYDSDLCHLFKTVIFLFKTLGCFMGTELWTSKEDEIKSPWTLLHKVYCVFIKICLLFFSSLLLAKLSHLQPLSSTWLITFAFTAVVASNAMIIIVTSYRLRTGRLQAWIKHFCEYEMAYGLNKDCEGILKKARVGLILHYIVSMLSCFCVNAILVVLPSVGDIFITDYLPKWLNYVLMSLAFDVMSLGMIVYMSLIILGSVCIGYEFDVITLKIKDFCSGLDGKMVQSEEGDVQIKQVTDEETITKLYKQHNHVCDRMSEFSDCIKHIQLMDFFVSLPVACFMFYFMLMKIETVEHRVITAIIMTAAFAHPVILCWAGSKVSLKAHEPLRYLWKMSPSSFSEKTARELLMFTTKLTGPPIGYSVYELFTITLPASLTIAGTLLTYFVVVVQFVPSDRNPCGPSVDLDLLSNLTSLLQNMTRLSA